MSYTSMTSTEMANTTHYHSGVGSSKSMPRRVSQAEWGASFTPQVQRSIDEIERYLYADVKGSSSGNYGSPHEHPLSPTSLRDVRLSTAPPSVLDPGLPFDCASVHSVDSLAYLPRAHSNMEARVGGRGTIGEYERSVLFGNGCESNRRTIGDGESASNSLTSVSHYDSVAGPVPSAHHHAASYTGYLPSPGASAMAGSSYSARSPSGAMRNHASITTTTTTNNPRNSPRLTENPLWVMSSLAKEHTSPSVAAATRLSSSLSGVVVHEPSHARPSKSSPPCLELTPRKVAAFRVSTPTIEELDLMDVVMFLRMRYGNPVQEAKHTRTLHDLTEEDIASLIHSLHTELLTTQRCLPTVANADHPLPGGTSTTTSTSSRAGFASSSPPKSGASVRFQLDQWSPVSTSLARGPIVTDSVAAGTPFTQEHQLLMRKGEVFLKFGRKGAPAPRLVCLQEFGGVPCIMWSVDCRSSPHGQLPVSSLRRIVRGVDSPIFERHKEPLSKAPRGPKGKGTVPEDCCFTLYFDTRTLDLCCIGSSQDDALRICDRWVQALSAMICFQLSLASSTI